MPFRSSTALEIPAPITIAETARRKLQRSVYYDLNALPVMLYRAGKGADKTPDPSLQEHIPNIRHSRCQAACATQELLVQHGATSGGDRCRQLLARHPAQEASVALHDAAQAELKQDLGRAKGRAEKVRVNRVVV